MSQGQRVYFQSFKNLFLDFLKYLFNSKEINTVNKSISDFSLSWYSHLKEANADHWRLSIDPPWALEIVEDKYLGKNTAYLLIGGEIEIHNFSFKSYNFYATIVKKAQHASHDTHTYLSCCEKEYGNTSRVVRRFHFDTGNENPETYESSSHMQFGGIYDREISAVKEREDVILHCCLDNKITLPRFPYPPIDIIVLLDMLLRQFNTFVERSFLETKTWLDLVRRSEDFRMKSYYCKINQYFNQKNPVVPAQNRTLFEFFCGKDCVF